MQNFVSLICALEFIEKNLRTRIKVADVAQAAYLSVSHLQSIFAQTFNVSVGDYVIKRKLCLAARDLIDTEKSVTEVAFDFGYANIESFSRAFKKQFLASPSTYRKHYQFSELYPPLNIPNKEGFDLLKQYDLEEIGNQILASKGTYVICVDIDKMDAINKEIGYGAGDAAIAESAARIGKSIEAGMSYYRIGADSFVVLTQDENLEVAEAIAQKIISFAQDEVEWREGTFKFSLSMGIVMIPQNTQKAAATLARAEEAMIAAKKDGRNCYKVQ